MFEEEECIYNLIPKPPPVIVKDPLHKSKFQDQSEFMTAKKRRHGTMGEPADIIRKDPKNFLKKGTYVRDLPPRTRTIPKGNEGLTKPPVPSAKDCHQLKPTAKKNFILENWKEAPKTRKLKQEKKETFYTEKPDYGQVPAYLERTKAQAEAEAKYWDEVRDSMMPEDTETRCCLIPEEQRLQILEGLHENLADLKKRYASLSFGQDNLSFRKKKEEMEVEMARLEADIKTFSRQNVYITEN